MKNFLALAGIVVMCCFIYRVFEDNPGISTAEAAPTSSVSPSDQATANSFVGLTETALVKRLGSPVSKDDHRWFRTYNYAKTEAGETFFTVYDDTKKVYTGCYHGTPTSVFGPPHHPKDDAP